MSRVRRSSSLPVGPPDLRRHFGLIIWCLAVACSVTACATFPEEVRPSTSRDTSTSNLDTSTSLPISADAWSIFLDDLGTFSSPRVADLNGDGVSDIVLGAGREEFIASDSAVVALDGRSGRVLWRVGARDQIFGSASLHDITDDDVMDVVIGGRSAELIAIDGARGDVLWEFFPEDDTAAIREAGFYNFYNPQFIPDVDDDGEVDLLISNGGDVLAAPDDPNRPAGRLMVISGASGRLVAAASMPDGRETYMSPVVADLAGSGEPTIVFGSGGETIGGHLYRVPLRDLLAGDVSTAMELASSRSGGFIGPPVLVDLTGDSILDIVANAVDGRMLAFDGADHRALWTVKMPDTESYTSPAVGHFTDDDVPDLFSTYATGTWPNLGWSRQFMVDGRTGEIAFVDSLGLYQASSPVVADLDRDGMDEVILTVNYEVVTESYQKRFYTMLVAIDFSSNAVVQLGDPLAGSNLASTPWIGDLDSDGRLDIVTVNTPDTLHTYVFNGLQVNRITTDIPLSEPLEWGGYMGSEGDGVFRDGQRMDGSPVWR